MAQRFKTLGLVLSLFLFTTAHASTPVKEKEWTFLVFLNGHNNLDPYGEMNIKQMEQVGSTDQVNIVVQWASMKQNTKRYLIQKSNNPKEVMSPVVEDLGKKVDMGSAEELYQFLSWGMKNYPAKKYFVNVWNHGTGWHRRVVDDWERDISYDDISGNKISTEDLGSTLHRLAKEDGKLVELYGSDACQMAMVEVAAEMKDAVKYFVGSQDLEPGEGWPYHKFLARWVKNPLMGGAELGAILVEEFTLAYSGGGAYGEQKVTLSALDLSAYDQFVSSLRGLSSAIQNLTPAQVKTLRAKIHFTQAFESDDYRDLYDFVEKLPLMGVQLSQNQVLDFRAAFAEFVIAEDADEDYIGAHGLSFWLPSESKIYQKHADRYSGLRFSQDSGWGEALKFIFK